MAETASAGRFRASLPSSLAPALGARQHPALQGEGTHLVLFDRDEDGLARKGVTFPGDGQFQAPGGWPADRRGVIDVGFPNHWNIGRAAR